MKKSWIAWGVKTIIWLTWLYPFLRLAAIPLIAAFEPYLVIREMNALMKAAKYLHGGNSISAFLTSWYMVYFAVSVVAYLVWHYKRDMRLGWGHWFALFLVILFNVLNVFLLRSVA